MTDSTPATAAPWWSRLRERWHAWRYPPLVQGPRCTGDFLRCGCSDCDEYRREGGKCHGG